LNEAFWSYVHILISKAYNNPEPHRHWAKHLIFSLDNEFECTIESTSFCCYAICMLGADCL
jgi:hypothetical protein